MLPSSSISALRQVALFTPQYIAPLSGLPIIPNNSSSRHSKKGFP
jgi:hypothetical protein